MPIAVDIDVGRAAQVTRLPTRTAVRSNSVRLKGEPAQWSDLADPRYWHQPDRRAPPGSVSTDHLSRENYVACGADAPGQTATAEASRKAATSMRKQCGLDPVNGAIQDDSDTVITPAPRRSSHPASPKACPAMILSVAPGRYRQRGCEVPERATFLRGPGTVAPRPSSAAVSLLVQPLPAAWMRRGPR